MFDRNPDTAYGRPFGVPRKAPADQVAPLAAGLPVLPAGWRYLMGVCDICSRDRDTCQAIPFRVSGHEFAPAVRREAIR